MILKKRGRHHPTQQDVKHTFGADLYPAMKAREQREAAERDESAWQCMKLGLQNLTWWAQHGGPARAWRGEGR